MADIVEEIKTPAEFNLGIFKEQLIAFSREANFRMCDSFKKQLINCEDAKNVKYLMQNYAEEIADRLGYEPDFDDCEECDRLKDEVKELEEEITLMNVETEDRRILNTLDYRQKIEAFHKHHKKYTSYQFEERLEATIN
jgi:hypothetical protein